jgi:hypothetical protein
MNVQIAVLIFLGIVSAIVLIAPVVVLFGYFLFFVPGIILTITPTLFAYLLFIFLLKNKLKKSFIQYPTIKSSLIVIGIGCLIAVTLNVPMWNQIRMTHNKDIALKENIDLPDTLAIFVDEFQSRFQKENGFLCNSLCQHLLYNGAVKKVLIGQNYSHNENLDNKELVSYSIEKGQNCLQEGYVSNSKENLAIKGIQMRLASGDCLSKSTSNLFDADMIYVKNRDARKHHVRSYWRLDRHVMFINKIELLTKTKDSYKPIYRFTKIEAQPFVVPLSFGPILGAGGGSLSANSGFFHYEKNVNTSGINYYNFYQDFKSELPNIFGEYLNQIDSVSNDNARKLIENILNKKYEDPKEKQQYFDWYIDFLTNYHRHKDVEIQSKDIELLTRGINDLQLKNFWSLNHVIYSQGEDKLLKLRPHIFNRMMLSTNYEQTRSLSNALAAFSPKNLIEYKIKIENASIDEKKMSWIQDQSRGKF